MREWGPRDQNVTRNLIARVTGQYQVTGVSQGRPPARELPIEASSTRSRP
jgi:hypothetical protein